MKNPHNTFIRATHFLQFIEAHPTLFLTAILAISAALRVFALLSLQGSIYSDFLVYDEIVYHNWAKSLAAGTIPTFDAWDFAPLPAYVFAILYKLFSPTPLSLRIFNICLGVLTCYTIYILGRDLRGRSAGITTGLVSALIAACYKPFIFFSITIHKTALSLFIFSIFAYLLISGLKTLQNQMELSHSPKRLTPLAQTFLMGISLGLLINVRPNAIVLLPLFPLFCLLDFAIRKKLKGCIILPLLYFCGIFLALLPFISRNYHLTGEFSLMPAGGYNLYLANNLDNQTPYYRPAPFATSIASEQATQFIIEASRREGKKLTPRESSSYWAGEVYRNLRENPVSYANKLLLKLRAFFNHFESADNHHIDFISNSVPFFKLPLFTFWSILPFGMAGMLLTTGSSRQSRALFLVFCAYGSTLILFFTNIRIRLPLLILLIPYAVYGIQHLFNSLPHQRLSRYPLYAGITCFFFIIEFIPVPGSADITAHLNTHAINLYSKGKIDEAVSCWKESAAMKKDYSCFANLSLAQYSFQKKEMEQAFSYLDKIPDSSFAAAYKYRIQGNIFLNMGLHKKAIAAYEKSLCINWGQLPIHLKLSQLYRRNNNMNSAHKIHDYDYIRSFYRQN